MRTNARVFRAALTGLLVLVSTVLVSAQELYVRVVDVGAGECVVIRAPGNDGGEHDMIYDAGNREAGGKTATDG